MSFGPDSMNPRERRAWAHMAIFNLRTNVLSYDAYEVAFNAVKAASQTRKGKASRLTETLGKGVKLVVNFTSGINDEHLFAGVLMPSELADAIVAYDKSAADNNSIPKPDFNSDDYPIAYFKHEGPAPLVQFDDWQVTMAINPASLPGVTIYPDYPQWESI